MPGETGFEVIGSDGKPLEAQVLFNELPKGVSTPELKINLAEGEQYKFVDEFTSRAKFETAYAGLCRGPA